MKSARKMNLPTFPVERWWKVQERANLRPRLRPFLLTVQSSLGFFSVIDLFWVVRPFWVFLVCYHLMDWCWKEKCYYIKTNPCEPVGRRELGRSLPHPLNLKKLYFWSLFRVLVLFKYFYNLSPRPPSQWEICPSLPHIKILMCTLMIKLLVYVNFWVKTL